MSLEDIANCLHINKASEYKAFTSMLSKMEQLGSLSWDNECLCLTHFEERQSQVPSGTKEAVRERVSRFREGKRVTVFPLQPADESPHAQAASDLREQIMAEFKQLPTFKNRQLEHEAVREVLIRLAERKGYLYTQELLTEQGRIDVVWSDSNHKPIAAFEIDDTAPQENSLAKLKAATSYPLRIIILRRSSVPLGLCEEILVISIEESIKETPSPPPKDKDIDKDIEGEEENTPLQSVTLPLHTLGKQGDSSPDVTGSPLQDKINLQEKEIFSHWIQQKIVNHKVLTSKMEGSIKSVLKTYTQQEICQAITNYAEIVCGIEYRWTYKWTLEDFLHRGLEKFMDGEVARSNYRIDAGGDHGKKQASSGQSGAHQPGAQAPTRDEYRQSLK